MSQPEQQLMTVYVTNAIMTSAGPVPPKGNSCP